MKIYIVHIDAYGDKDFSEVTNEEIKDLYEAGSCYVDCYESVEELAANWNTDEIFYPNVSYMRVIND